MWDSVAQRVPSPVAHIHFSTIILTLIIIYDYAQSSVRHFPSTQESTGSPPRNSLFQDRQTHKWQKCWPNSPSSPQVPALLADLGKLTFLLPVLSPIPLFAHPSCSGWKMFSSDHVHVFVLESLSEQSLSMFLQGIVLFFGKMKSSIFHSILSNVCAGNKRIQCFLMAKKTRKWRFGAFGNSHQSLEFSGEGRDSFSWK